MPRALTSTQIGDAFEQRVHDYFCSEIAANRFWAKRSCCKVFHKKGYYSKDRNSEIVFDVAIELYLPGAKDYSSLILIECKDYSHPVPVDDTEEFFAKVQQVASANSKAILASTAAFQSGAREYAKSKGIGLLRYFDRREFKWELKRSPSASARSVLPDDACLLEEGLSQPNFRPQVFDLYLQSPLRKTNSLWDFFEDLVLDSGLTPSQVSEVANSRGKLSNQVPFLEKVSLEEQGAEILVALQYAGGEVSLDALCAREARRAGLIVTTDVVHSKPTRDPFALGRITFEPLTIELFAQDSHHRGRDRFTLAHELAHHFLEHGRFMVREYCEDNDFALHRGAIIDGSDIARMEFQANYLASAILMPRSHFLEDFQRLVRALDIPNRGHGALYVDDQKCNLQNYDFVTSALMQRYGVSRTATKIRLESMDLLRDARQTLFSRSIVKSLA